MEDKQPKTKCDLCRISCNKGFLNLFSGEITKTCEMTGTTIPDEHQKMYCWGNFFNCQFFKEYLEGKPKMIKVVNESR